MAFASSSKSRDFQSRLQPLIFPPLEDNDSNYLEWAIDAKMHLITEEIVRAIQIQDQGTQPVVEEVSASVCSRALQALRHYLGYSLWKEYIQLEDPAELWQQLRNRFLHEKTIFLPQARYDWMSLRMLDFPDISSFNSE